MIYMFRIERAERIRHLPNRQIEIVEFVRGNWRPSGDDVLLLTEGSNLELVFQLGVAVEKVAVDHARLDDHDGFRLTIHGRVTAEPRVTLSQMMYSLVRVSNFARPGLNVRHHSRVLEHDYERIVNGSVHARRSIYFGILQRLHGERESPSKEQEPRSRPLCMRPTIIVGRWVR
jgi:hypothetical protein